MKKDRIEHHGLRNLSLNGVLAAMLTPRTDDGELDRAGFRRQVEFLMQFSLSGFAVNGATGEFPLTSLDELQWLLETVRAAAPERTLLCGVGAMDVPGARRAARLAADAGADALLLPMPHLFPYRQDDLASFVAAVLEAAELPVLLYNLPQFTTGLEAETVLALLRRFPGLVGIKDSSGNLDILRHLTALPSSPVRLVGNDAALAPALGERVCDGVVSGVACVLPELVLALYSQIPGSEGFAFCRQLLDRFLADIEGLPTPWGLKITSQMRNLAGGAFPMPLSAARQQEAEALRASFDLFLPKVQSLPALITSGCL